MLVSTPNVASSISAQAFVSVLPEQSKQSVSERITVLVDGDAGLAVSCLFAQNGYSVRACTTEKNVVVPTDYEIRTRQASVSNFRGRVPFVSIETDLSTVLYESDAVIVASPATEYGALVEKTISHLRHGQTILLTNAPLGAGMQFSAAIKKTGVELHVNIIEMGTLFDCAKVEENVLLITGLRDNVSVSANKRNEMRRGLFVASALSKGLVPSSNSIERGLSDVERMLRPTLIVAGMMGGREDSLGNIQSWLSPSSIAIVAGLDTEIQNLAKVFKCVVPSFSRALREFALNQPVASKGARTDLETLLNSLGQSLFDTADGVPLATVSQFVKRDIVETLMLIADFARLSRCQMPILESVIQLGQVILKEDFSRQGRSLEDLGLVGFDVEEIIELFNA